MENEQASQAPPQIHLKARCGYCFGGSTVATFEVEGDILRNQTCPRCRGTGRRFVNGKPVYHLSEFLSEQLGGKVAISSTPFHEKDLLAMLKPARPIVVDDPGTPEGAVRRLRWKCQSDFRLPQIFPDLLRMPHEHYVCRPFTITYERMIRGKWVECDQTVHYLASARNTWRNLLEQAIDRCKSCGGLKEHFDGGCNDDGDD